MPSNKPAGAMSQGKRGKQSAQSKNNKPSRKVTGSKRTRPSWQRTATERKRNRILAQYTIVKDNTFLIYLYEKYSELFDIIAQRCKAQVDCSEEYAAHKRVMDNNRLSTALLSRISSVAQTVDKYSPKIITQAVGIGAQPKLSGTINDALSKAQVRLAAVASQSYIKRCTKASAAKGRRKKVVMTEAQKQKACKESQARCKARKFILLLELHYKYLQLFSVVGAGKENALFPELSTRIDGMSKVVRGYTAANITDALAGFVVEYTAADLADWVKSPGVILAAAAAASAKPAPVPDSGSLAFFGTGPGGGAAAAAATVSQPGESSVDNLNHIFALDKEKEFYAACSLVLGN